MQNLVSFCGKNLRALTCFIKTTPDSAFRPIPLQSSSMYGCNLITGHEDWQGGGHTSRIGDHDEARGEVVHFQLAPEHLLARLPLGAGQRPEGHLHRGHHPPGHPIKPKSRWWSIYVRRRSLKWERVQDTYMEKNNESKTITWSHLENLDSSHVILLINWLNHIGW